MTRLQRWETTVEWPMTLAALLFLIAYATPIVDPTAPSAVVTAATVVTWLTWALFAIDYVVRVVLAEDRRRHVTTHWLDLAIIALPLLRPLRLLRLATLLSVLDRRASTGLRGRVAIYIGGSAALLALCGALAVLDAERGDPHANIVTFGDAIWWAVVTMTTVGYGDRYPVTAVGRLAAAVLMIGGIAILGVVTAALASWLVKHVTVTEENQTDTLSDQIAELQAQVAGLTAVIAADAAARTLAGAHGPDAGDQT